MSSIQALRVQAGVEEEMEQRRRQLDLGGEAFRRSIAKEVSAHIPRYAVLNHIDEPIIKKAWIEEKEEITLEFSKPSILTRGWSAIQHAAEVAAATFETVVDKTGAAAESLGHKTSDVVESIVDSSVHAAQQVPVLKEKLVAKTSEVAEKAVLKGELLGQQIVHTASDVADQIAPVASKIVQSTHDIGLSLAQKTGEVAVQAVEKSSELGHKIGDFVEKKYEESKLVLEELKEDAAFEATLIYVKAQEKIEQARRMTSGDEQIAVLNAFAVSSLIADLDIAFYKQSPLSKLYGVKLLESMEMRWRVFNELDGFSLQNAKKESALISQYWSTHSESITLTKTTLAQGTTESGLPVKVAIVEAITIPSNAPATAAQ